jgi:hypothetical protein
VATAEPLAYEEFVDLLRARLGIADDVNPDESHSFKTLMGDQRDVAPDHWYHRAFDDLEAEWHIDPAASGKTMGDANARLSPEGREYLKSQGDES